MARANTVTKLSLDEYARLMGLNPLHFNGVVINEMQRTPCDTAWYQYPWQKGGTSREEIAEAIEQAESMIELQLRSRLLPTWQVDERVLTARGPRPELVRIGSTDLRGYRQTVRAGWGRFISGGIRKATLVQAAAPIVYDNTVLPATYNNRATVTVAVPQGTAPCSVCVYYPGHAGAEAWRIRPVVVDVTGLVATITFRRQQAVAEALLESMDVAADSNQRLAIGSVDASFLTAVDVYTVVNDPSTQASLLWAPPGVDCSSDDLSAFSTQTAALMLASDPALSVLSYIPAEWDAATSKYTGVYPASWNEPDQIRLYYLAGLEAQGVACSRWEMDPAWAYTVAVLASALLSKPPCGCQTEVFGRWQTDLAFVGGAEQISKYDVSRADLDCPFGTRLGQVYAYRRCMQDGAAAGAGAVVAV